jgi:hypothetical protein
VSARRKIVAKLALGAGLIAAASIALPALPHDHKLILVAPSEGRIEQIEASVVADGETEAVRGFSLNFVGGAPARHVHAVSLPNGRYRLNLLVRGRTAGGAQTQTSLSRRVTLDGSDTTVQLRLSE